MASSDVLCHDPELLVAAENDMVAGLHSLQSA
jgi:hypothetical protein